jgi:hypothetical protein
MLLHCPESLFAFVCVPAVLHFHYMNRWNCWIIYPLDSPFLLWLSGYPISWSGRYLSHLFLSWAVPSGVSYTHSHWYPGAQLCCVPFGHAIIRVCGVWYAAGVGLIFL